MCSITPWRAACRCRVASLAQVHSPSRAATDLDRITPTLSSTSRLQACRVYGVSEDDRLCVKMLLFCIDRAQDRRGNRGELSTNSSRQTSSPPLISGIVCVLPLSSALSNYRCLSTQHDVRPCEHRLPWTHPDGHPNRWTTHPPRLTTRIIDLVRPPCREHRPLAAVQYRHHHTSR